MVESGTVSRKMYQELFLLDTVYVCSTSSAGRKSTTAERQLTARERLQLIFCLTIIN